MKNSERLRTVLLLAIEDDAIRASGGFDPALCLKRSDACRDYALSLKEEGRFPEAALHFQEAVDHYLLLDSEEAKQRVSECAKLALDCVFALRSEPWNRLSLLIVKHERRRQQLSLMPGSEAEQAACEFQIGRIFQRRDRPEEALERFQEAIALLSHCEPTLEVRLALADCHHCIAILYQNPLQSESLANRHYELAFRLYETCDPEQSVSKMPATLYDEALKRLGS